MGGLRAITLIPFQGPLNLHRSGKGMGESAEANKYQNRSKQWDDLECRFFFRLSSWYWELQRVPCAAQQGWELELGENH